MEGGTGFGQGWRMPVVVIHSASFFTLNFPFFFNDLGRQKGPTHQFREDDAVIGLHSSHFVYCDQQEYLAKGSGGLEQQFPN